MSFDGNVLHEPWAVMNGSGEPYRVFTLYWKAVARMSSRGRCRNRPRCREPALRTPSLALAELGLLPSIPWDKGLREAWTLAGARARGLAAFLDGIWIDYDSARNLLAAWRVVAVAAPALGELSPRQVWSDAIGACCGNQPLESHGGESFLRELAWREFAIHVPGTGRRVPISRCRHASRNTPGPRTTRVRLPRGSTGAPAIRWSMPACASSGPPAGCTTARG